MPRNVSTGEYTYPDGTPGNPGQTIFSTRYNTFINDLKLTLNTKLPVNMGGTNADDANEARTNLQAEVSVAGQTVTNYDSHAWETGSFRSNPGAISSPDGLGIGAANYYAGTVQVFDTNSSTFVQARSLSTGINYLRIRVGPTWGAWTADSGSGAFVLKAGDTMTGTLTVTAPWGGVTLNTPDTSTNPILSLGQGGVQRFQFQTNTSDLYLIKFNDTGTAATNALVVNRASGAVTVDGAIKSTVGELFTYGTAGSVNSGVVRFSSDSTKYLWYDGSKFNFAGGGLNTGSGTVSNILGTLTTDTIFASANISGANITGASVTSNGNMRLGNSNPKGGVLYFGADNTCYLQHDGTSTWYLVGGSATLVVYGSIVSSVNISGSSITANTFYSNTSTALRSNSSETFQIMLSVDPGWGQNCYLYAQHQPGVKVVWNFRVGSVNYEFDHVGTARKPGGGAWVDISDARIKTVLGNYDHGLDEILQLNPVRYVYKGNDTVRDPANIVDTPDNPEREEKLKQFEGVTPTVPYKNSPHYQPAIDQKEFVGFIAQDVEPVMPEMVSQHPGFIDGKPVTDIRELDPNALIFALVNAVKTLEARVKTLEAGGA